MDFTTFHKDYFNSPAGAFSRVTERENQDSQITLTDSEADLVIHFFDKRNIVVGNVRSNPQLANKELLLYPTFDPIHLNIVFPKPNKRELRLYLSTIKGFKPSPDEIWFIYLNRVNDLVIGSLPENIWSNLGQTDNIDDEYQDKIEEALLVSPNVNISPDGRIVTTLRNSQTIYVRDPRLAIMRFSSANYQCEIDSTHNTFTAQISNLQFMEAHHFIPMKYQPHFSNPLDNFYNIVSLCPNCHRGIHHAVIDYKYDLISQLYAKRPELHTYSLDYIAQFYNSIKVPFKDDI